MSLRHISSRRTRPKLNLAGKAWATYVTQAPSCQVRPDLTLHLSLLGLGFKFDVGFPGTEYLLVSTLVGEAQQLSNINGVLLFQTTKVLHIHRVLSVSVFSPFCPAP